MPKNQQPWYHQMDILFTGTEDVSETANSEAFRKKLARFLADNLPGVIKRTVNYDAEVSAEPGDPADLM